MGTEHTKSILVRSLQIVFFSLETQKNCWIKCLVSIGYILDFIYFIYCKMACSKYVKMDLKKWKVGSCLVIFLLTIYRARSTLGHVIERAPIRMNSVVRFIGSPYSEVLIVALLIAQSSPYRDCCVNDVGSKHRGAY